MGKIFYFCKLVTSLSSTHTSPFVGQKEKTKEENFKSEMEKFESDLKKRKVIHKR